MDTNRPGNRSLLNFALLEFTLSIPFWGWVALAHAGVVPDLQMLNAAWSLTPMMAASILVYRERGAAGLQALSRRCFDYQRIKSKAWILPILFLEPFIVFTQYGTALLLGSQTPAPHFTLLVPLAYLGFFFGVFGEELGWTGYAIDPMQERWTALKSSILLGIMCASFHTPVWIFTGASLYWIAWQWIYVVATRVLFVWIYNNTGKSLFAIALVQPGMGIYWYLWPVSANLGIPVFYDPRNLAFVAIVLAALVTFLWGSRTLAQIRYRRASDGRAHIQNRHREAAA